MFSILKKVLKSDQVLFFFVLTFTFTWLLVGIVLVTGSMEMLMNIAVLGPLVAASVITWLAGGSLRSWAGQILIWHTGLRWYLATLGLPVLLVAAQVGMYLLLGGEDPVELAAIPTRFVYLMPLFIYNTFLHGGLEELGWRGFALPRLQKHFNALMASLVIGFFWALWHLPLFFLPGTYYAQISPFSYLLELMALSVVFTWIYNNTGGSVLLCMLLHGAYNTRLLLYPYPLDLEEMPEIPLRLEVAGVIVMLFVALIIILSNTSEWLTNKDQKTCFE